MQKSAFTYSPRGISEDCLYLNVFGAEDPTSMLPVAVFFYGGGWKYGASSFPIYDGTNMLFHGGLNKKMVVVTVNYRVGAFGWLGGSSIAMAPGSGEWGGNAGLGDQRASLQWVQDNIEYFGGDPSRVTVWGESAGAGSISAHLVSPPSAGLFDQAIIESGPIAFWVAQTLAYQEEQFQFMSGQLNCTSVECMQAVPAQQLLHGVSARPPTQPDRFTDFVPTVDGINLPEHPVALAASGYMNEPKPRILLGSNLNEGTILLPTLHTGLNASSPLADFVTWLGTIFTPTQVTEITQQQYPMSNYSSPWSAALQLLTDYAMACPARRTARWLGPDTASFLYLWTHEVDVAKLDPSLGVFHGSELLFVFDTKTFDDIPLPLSPWEFELQDEMVRLWSSFIIDGTPSDPAWLPFNASLDVRYVLDEKRHPIVDYRSSQCAFWDKVEKERFGLDE